MRSTSDQGTLTLDLSDLQMAESVPSNKRSLDWIRQRTGKLDRKGYSFCLIALLSALSIEILTFLNLQAQTTDSFADGYLNGYPRGVAAYQSNTLSTDNISKYDDYGLLSFGNVAQVFLGSGVLCLGLSTLCVVIASCENRNNRVAKVLSVLLSTLFSLLTMAFALNWSPDRYQHFGEECGYLNAAWESCVEAGFNETSACAQIFCTEYPDNCGMTIRSGGTYSAHTFKTSQDYRFSQAGYLTMIGGTSLIFATAINFCGKYFSDSNDYINIAGERTRIADSQERSS